MEIEKSRRGSGGASESSVTRSNRAPVKVKFKFRKSRSSSSSKEHFFRKWGGARTTSDDWDDQEKSPPSTDEKKPPKTNVRARDLSSGKGDLIQLWTNYKGLRGTSRGL